MYRRLAVLFPVAVMLASSGMASAAVLANGKGGEMASPSAALGIQRFSVWLTHTHDDRILSSPRGRSTDHMCMQYGVGQFLRKPL